MGAWGAGPLDNDAALDLIQAWKRFRAGGYPAEYSMLNYLLKKPCAWCVRRRNAAERCLETQPTFGRRI